MERIGGRLARADIGRVGRRGPAREHGRQLNGAHLDVRLPLRLDLRVRESSVSGRRAPEEEEPGEKVGL